MKQRVLFSTPLAKVTEHHCRPHDRGCGREEHSTTDEIVFVRGGAFTRHVGRRHQTLNANHVAFFHRHAPYRVSHPVEWGDDCLAIWIRPDVLGEIVTQSDPAARDRSTLFSCSQGPCDSRLHFRAMTLFRALAAGTLADASAEEALLALAQSAVAAALGSHERRPVRQGPDTNRAHAELVEATKAELSRQFSQRISLDDLARQVHSSPFHLARVFRRDTGLSIHAYRHQLRLRSALDRLAEDGRDLTALALELGFYDHGHFTAAFRRAFGQTPSRFRRTASTHHLGDLSTIFQA